jgi:hypothetical protein
MNEHLLENRLHFDKGINGLHKLECLKVSLWENKKKRECVWVFVKKISSRFVTLKMRKSKKEIIERKYDMCVCVCEYIYICK